MDLLELIQSMLKEAENSLDEAIRNDGDFKYWRGYRDAVNAVIRLVEGGK